MEQMGKVKQNNIYKQGFIKYLEMISNLPTISHNTVIHFSKKEYLKYKTLVSNKENETRKFKTKNKKSAKKEH